MGSKLKVRENIHFLAMAGIEEELKCSMCLDTFRLPKALPCQHTFCMDCLQKYISTQAKFIANNDGYFNCPLCRIPTKPNNNNPDINSWAKSFPNNHTIASVIDCITVQKANEKDTSRKGDTSKSDYNHSAGGPKKNRDGGAAGTSPVLCSLCKLLLGSRWCEQCCQNLCGSCEKNHSQNPDTKIHVVVDAPMNNNAHSSAESTLETEHDQANNRPCNKHPGQIDSYYCAKCSIACCGVCVSADHSTCFKVLPLQQAVKNKVQLGQVYMSIIGLQKDNLKHLQTVVSTKLKESHTHHDNLCREILSIRPMVNKILAEEEKSLLDELKAKTKNITSELNRMQTSCDSNIGILNAKGEVLQGTLAMKTVQRLHFLSIWDDISDFMKKNSSQHQDIKSHLENLHMCNINFERSNLIMSVLKGTDSTIGSLVLRRASTRSSASVSGGTPSASNYENPAQSPGELKLKSYRNVRLDSEGPPLLTGICVLPDNILVMTDFSNNKLKMFDKERQLKYCILPTSPYGVTYRPDTDQIIVSLPSSKELAYISSTLKIEKHVKVLKEYSAVLFNKQEKTLLCTSTNPGCIEILYDDVVVRTLGLPSSRRPLFSEPEYVALYSKQNILVSDWEKKALFCVDNKGNVVSTFTGELGVNELQCPLGVAIDTNGFIYLADKEASRIFRFSADFKFESIVLTQNDRITQPMAMAFDSRGHLFVTEKSGYLKVFG